MWDAGASLRDIAMAHGVSENSMAWYVHTARRELGPTWFPHRPVPVATPVVSPDMPHLPEIRRRWLAGESHITIAAAIGLSPGLLLQRMHKARQRYGRDILPMRVRRRALMSDADAHAADIAAKQRAEEYAQAIQPLWSATVSVGVLASRLGVSAEVVRYRIRFIRRWLGSDVLPKQR